MDTGAAGVGGAQAPYAASPQTANTANHWARVTAWGDAGFMQAVISRLPEPG